MKDKELTRRILVLIVFSCFGLQYTVFFRLVTRLVELYRNDLKGNKPEVRATEGKITVNV